MIHHSGQIEIICGSMFCGKTEELIRRVRRAIIGRQKVQVFKPALDDRFGIEEITSHDGQKVKATALTHADDLFKSLERDTTIVAIDEVQFFDAGIVAVIERLAERGIRVLVAGLDMDFRGEPFGAMPQLLARAESVTKLSAICVICGDHASRTQRLVNGEPAHYDDPVILVGASESYEARCRSHHRVPRGDARRTDTIRSVIESSNHHQSNDV